MLGESYSKHFKTNRKVHEMVRSLKHQDYNVSVLSNTIPSHAATIQSQDIKKIFDVNIINSHEVKARKPERKIFRKALKVLDCESYECVFIDANEDFVFAAKDMGFHSIVFKNSDQLKKELAELGVFV